MVWRKAKNYQLGIHPYLHLMYMRYCKFNLVLMKDHGLYISWQMFQMVYYRLTHLERKGIDRICRKVIVQ